MTNLLLKLDFNERSDNPNPITAQFSSGDALWAYPQRQPLEKQIAKLFDLSPTQVLCTNGGDEAIMILMRLIKETNSVDQGQLILPLPAFSQYTWGIKSWKLNASQILPQKNGLSINTDQLLESITANRSSTIILTRPNNPTGESIAFNCLIQLITAAAENNSWVFLDEAYIEFSEEESVASSLLNRFDNLVILRTLSKAYGLAGIRLGYLLGSEKLISEFKKRCMPFNISKYSLDIANKALAQDSQADVKDYCKTIIKNRKKMTSWITEIGITVQPSQANFIILELPNGQARAVSSFLLKNNISIKIFDIEALVSCIRITIPYRLTKLMLLLKQCLQPELICLDMDGVLIETKDSYDQCVIATVKVLSDKVISLESIKLLRNRGGYNNEWILSQKLLSNLGVNLPLDAVTKVFQDIYLGSDNDGLCANEIPIISSKFKSVIKRSTNCTFAIVTGRPRVEAITGQELIELSELELVSLDDVSIGKPSPEGIEKLQQAYSNLSWMCGDNVDDMQAAVASNSLAIGIGRENAEILYQAGADIVFENINQLESWLCQIKL